MLTFIKILLMQMRCLSVWCFHYSSATNLYVGVAGQYWQSMKAFSGSVSLSYLDAQRRDCEETDAVNALASLSVGVISNEGYSTHFLTHTHTNKITQ